MRAVTATRFDAVSLLNALRRIGLRMARHQDNLVLEGPTGILDDDLLAAVRREKPRLLLLLRCEDERPCGPPPIPGSVSALELKWVLGWDAHRFSRLCHALLARPGPSSREEDQLVLRAMLERSVPPAPERGTP